MKFRVRRYEEGGKVPGMTDYAESGSAGGSGVSFKEAFKAAREQGLDEFTWRGKTYTTELAEYKKPEKKEKDDDVMAMPKGPKTRGSRRKDDEDEEEAPGRRYKGEYGETREALSSLSPSQKRNALAAGITTAASMAAGPALAAAGTAGRTGAVGVRGMTLAQRERDAAAAAEYAKRMKRLKETAEARSRMSRGATYKKGGMVHSSASRRADGIAQKGKTKGRVI